MFDIGDMSTTEEYILYGENLLIRIMRSNLSVGVEAAEQMIKTQRTGQQQFIHIEVVHMNPLNIQVGIGVKKEVLANADYYKSAFGKWIYNLQNLMSSAKPDEVIVSLFYMDRPHNLYRVMKLKDVYSMLK